MSTFIDIHILQDLPPSCVNRDDSGSPKSALYGGVRRLRVSSQSWKRATRRYFFDYLDASEVGIRTKRVVEILSDRIRETDHELTDVAPSLAEKVFKAAGIKVKVPQKQKETPAESEFLLFLSPSQIRRLAEIAIQVQREGIDLAKDKKIVRKIREIFKEDHAVDIALFGRMVAGKPELNVDAACQVAHAISTHAAETEYDFFTAVDDVKSQTEAEDVGAAMIGTVEFSSATMYRYATLNLDMLIENMGSREAALHALEVFLQAFILSMPTGKQNTFANRTLPSSILINVRDDQPVSFVGAFEKPIRAGETTGFSEPSVEALAAYSKKFDENYGLKPQAAFVVTLNDSPALHNLGERTHFADLPRKVREEVARGSNEEAS